MNLFVRLCFSLLAALFLSPICLQAQNRIVAAPDAVELRKVWEKKGRHLRTDEYGTAMWGGIDISGDGVADFGVYQKKGDYPDTWHFYRRGENPDTAAFWRFDSVSSQLGFGNFYGDDTLYILFRDGRFEIIDDFIYTYDRLRLYRLTDTGAAFPPRQSVYQGEKTPPVSRTIQSISSSDVNNDGISDVSVILSGIRVGHDRFNYDERGQIWIYLGGADFQLDSPSVIVYDVYGDSSTPDGFLYGTELRDFDGDGRIDVRYSSNYEGVGPLVRFRWGDENSPQSWTTRPVDRTIHVNDPGTGRPVQFVGRSYQLDGDPGQDFVSVAGNDDGSSSALIYLSSSASVRTRDFQRHSADSEFVLPERFGYGGVSTFLNDSLRRFEMLPFAKPGQRIFLSGGTEGLDADFEAYFNEEREGWVLGDVTGDGWYDYGASYAQDGSLGAASGIAVIYAGGPYIPLDDTTLSVREEPVAGESGGLFLWPNPVEDELHIAWRGDLRQMPARFEVYDAQGRIVVSGDVEPGRGEAVWLCADVPAGHYTLVGYERSGRQIAAAPVILR